jgi:hypothetical protein
LFVSSLSIISPRKSFHDKIEHIHGNGSRRKSFGCGKLQMEQMRLLFAGTRGEIDARSPRHRRHSSLLVIQRGKRILIDCGVDWRGKIDQLGPDIIVLTPFSSRPCGRIERWRPLRRLRDTRNLEPSDTMPN